MQITISEKSPVYSKLIALGNTLSLDPSLLAAGMCHAALNSTTEPVAEGSGTIMPVVYTTDPMPTPALIPSKTTPEPAVHQPVPAGSSGMFDSIA